MELTYRMAEGTFDLEFLRRLYENSFPLDERRDFQEMLSLMHAQKTEIWIAYAADQPVGFISLWQFSTFTYIEHFAVDPFFRGFGYGSSVFEHIYTRFNGRMVLEVEPPDSEDARRRIQFYERLHMQLTDYPYVQPAYTAHSAAIPLCIMVGEKMDIRCETLEPMIREMQHKVYGLE